jgi:hypothetical protein
LALTSCKEQPKINEVLVSNYFNYGDSLETAGVDSHSNANGRLKFDQDLEQPKIKILLLHGGSNDHEYMEF